MELDIEEINKILDELEALKKLYDRIQTLTQTTGVGVPSNLTTDIWHAMQALRDKLDHQRILREVNNW